jgi:molybdate transport system ATP-binding protein
MLEARLSAGRGAFMLDLELRVGQREVLVVVGESGAGKTTLLRLLAGLDHPDRGRVRLGNDTWCDTDSGIELPPWRRSIGYVPQDYALFPHLTALENAGFGLEVRDPTRAERTSRAHAALTECGVADLADRRPAALSGGQQQRVALARAIAIDPALLLLDEPLSAVDPATRRQLRRDLRTLLARRPHATVLVTHDPTDALLFGDRIAVLERGRITQEGTRDTILRQPRSEYVAAMLGTNLFRGEIEAVAEGGLARLLLPDGALLLPDPGVRGTVHLTVNPREITLYLEPPVASVQNLLRGRVLELVALPPDGERVRVVLETHPALVAEVTREGAARLALREGASVYAGFKATGAMVYP